VQHWVSTHGIAVNVDIDLREFERIDPCGLGAAVMTNMRLEGSSATMEHVRSWAVQRATEHFATFRVQRESVQVSQ
jgi:lipoate-protein ligase B